MEARGLAFRDVGNRGSPRTSTCKHSVKLVELHSVNREGMPFVGYLLLFLPSPQSRGDRKPLCGAHLLQSGCPITLAVSSPACVGGVLEGTAARTRTMRCRKAPVSAWFSFKAEQKIGCGVCHRVGGVLHTAGACLFHSLPVASKWPHALRDPGLLCNEGQPGRPPSQLVPRHEDRVWL